MKNLLKVRKIAVLKSSRKELGFTTLEILISLLIALGFVAVSMQSLVYAMAIKVQAQEKQRANELIQEDIERINQLGSTLPTPPVAATCNSANYSGGYAKALWDALQADDILRAGTPTPSPLPPPTKTIIKKVKSDGSLDPGGKQLALRRFHVSSTAANSITPHRTLKVGYQVWDWNGTNYTNKTGGTLGTGDEPIAETYVEVIPDVALQCP
jgi:type II secretory pathway pseudopilin PulG